MNRYGLFPTVVTNTYKGDKRDLSNPIKYKRLVGRERPTMEKLRRFNAWKRYVYSFLALAFSPLVKDAEGFALSREDMGGHFMDGGRFDFTEVLPNGNPATKKTDSLCNVFQRRGNMDINWDQVVPQHGSDIRKFTTKHAKKHKE